MDGFFQYDFELEECFFVGGLLNKVKELQDIG